MIPGPRHSFEDHTAEVRLAVSAPTLPELFAEAGRALAELALGDAPLPAPEDQPEDVSLSSVDLDALIVDWLNELVFRSEVSRRVYVEFCFDELDATGPGGKIRGKIRGAHVPEARPLVKAATLHDVHVTEGPDGYSARVVLDI